MYLKYSKKALLAFFKDEDKYLNYCMTRQKLDVCLLKRA